MNPVKAVQFLCSTYEIPYDTGMIGAVKSTLEMYAMMTNQEYKSHMLEQSQTNKAAMTALATELGNSWEEVLNRISTSAEQQKQ